MRERLLSHSHIWKVCFQSLVAAVYDKQWTHSDWEIPFGNSFVCPFCSSQVNTKYINIDEKKNTIITYVSAEVNMWCWMESPDLHSYFSLRYISLSEGLKQEDRPMQEAFVLIFHFILYS